MFKPILAKFEGFVRKNLTGKPDRQARMDMILCLQLLLGARVQEAKQPIPGKKVGADVSGQKHRTILVT
jgi:hypothetical protein